MYIYFVLISNIFDRCHYFPFIIYWLNIIIIIFLWCSRNTTYLSKWRSIIRRIYRFIKRKRSYFSRKSNCLVYSNTLCKITIDLAALISFSDNWQNHKKKQTNDRSRKFLKFLLVHSLLSVSFIRSDMTPKLGW